MKTYYDKSWKMSQRAVETYKELSHYGSECNYWCKSYISKFLKIKPEQIDDYDVTFEKGYGVRMSVCYWKEEQQ